MEKMCSCKQCGSSNLIKKGMNDARTLYRFKCKDCNSNLYDAHDKNQGKIEILVDDRLNSTFQKSLVIDSNVTRFVITSAQSNTQVDTEFLSSLELYCTHNNAQLMILPVRYKNPTSLHSDDTYPSLIDKYLVTDVATKIHPKLKVLSNIKVAATTMNPLTGLDSICKGDSVILGHNKLQMKTVPVQKGDISIIMATTGTISKPNYSDSKSGYVAGFNHSASAIVVELDGDIFHMRPVEFDGEGFYDIDLNYYTHTVIVKNVKDAVTAIVTGDEHVEFFDKEVKHATYGKGGMVDMFNPKYIVRHDLLDFHSASHHHIHDIMLKYRKYLKGTNNVERELNEVCNHLIETTPKGVTNIIVSSNHLDHLSRWLNEHKHGTDPTNDKVWCGLMYRFYEAVEKNPNASFNPLELHIEKKLKTANCSVTFLDRDEVFMIEDINIGMHGDAGANGSRGSRKQFSNLPSKTVIGHSHSPGIENGAWQVGTSSVLKMDYNKGASSWLNSHIIILKNGKRTLLNIIRGKFKA